ncbi:MAG: DUF4271 domain-containing protein [Paludibacteraceae bacterium]|nr:DUF4271 domain-containing protein [Paludibacteraceae bacterium]
MIPHIEGLAGSAWGGVVAFFVVMGYVYSLGLSARAYVRMLSALGKGGCGTVRYTDGVIDWRVGVVLYGSVVVAIAMGVFALAVRMGGVGFALPGFAAVVGGTVVVVLLKWALAKLIGVVFTIGIGVALVKVTAVYVCFGFVTVVLSMLATTAISTFLLSVLMAISMFIVIVAKFAILVENFFVKVGSLFYIFLYLCAAEILPLTVGLRFVSQVFN